MSFLIKKYLANKKLSTNYTKDSTNWFLSNLSSPNNNFKKITLNQIKLGSFYYINYDPQSLNKSTNIEKKSIAFIVDYKPNIDKSVFWAINFNFLPSEIRKNFFLKFLDEKYDQSLKTNESLPAIKQHPLLVNYESILVEMSRFNIVYGTSIRPYKISLIHDIYSISTDYIDKLISLDVKPISGMDDSGIMKVLRGKLKNEGIHGLTNDLVKVRSDYETILSELKEKFSKLEKEI